MPYKDANRCRNYGKCLSIPSRRLLQEAEKLYRLVLQNNPENPAALHSLGIIAH